MLTYLYFSLFVNLIAMTTLKSLYVVKGTASVDNQ